MRKLYTLLAVLTITLTNVAQDTTCDTLIFESGNGTYKNTNYPSLTGAYIYDSDGATYHANVQDRVGSASGSWHLYREVVSAGDTNNALIAYSWFNPSDTADNWLYFGGIPVDENGLEVSWKHRMQDPDYRDGYDVVIFTADYTQYAVLETFSMNDDRTVADTISWATQSATIDTFAGEEVLLYFMHNTLDGYSLLLDDILVTKCTTVSDTTSDNDTTSNNDTTVTDTVVVDPVDTTIGDTVVTNPIDTNMSSDTSITSVSDTIFGDTIIINNTDSVFITDTVFITIKDTVEITVKDTIEITVTDTVTIGGNGDTVVVDQSVLETININISGSCATGVASELLEGEFDNSVMINAYPNPVKDELTINITNTSSIQSFTLNIYDILGNVKTTLDFFGDISLPMNLSSLSSGMYYIEVIGDDQVLSHQAFIKE